nr:translation initiation factor IF-2-like [Equus asinus]
MAAPSAAAAAAAAATAPGAPAAAAPRSCTPRAVPPCSGKLGPSPRAGSPPRRPRRTDPLRLRRRPAVTCWAGRPRRCARPSRHRPGPSRRPRPRARRGRLRAPGAWLSLPLPGSALSRRAGLRLRLAHLPGAASQCRLGEESRAEEIQTLRLKGEVLRETSPFQQTSIRTEKGPGTATSFSFPVVFGQRAQTQSLLV